MHLNLYKLLPYVTASQVQVKPELKTTGNANNEKFIEAYRIKLQKITAKENLGHPVKLFYILFIKDKCSHNTKKH